MAAISAPRPAEGLASLIEAGAAGDPALVSPEDGRALTYGQLAARIETISGRLAGAGVRRGDRVALALGNGPELVEIVLATIALGAAAAPLNPAYTSDEFTFYLGDIEPRLLVLASSLPPAERAAEATSSRIARLTDGGDGPPGLAVDGSELRAASPAEGGGPDDVAIVLHTSGTTSRPKQVPLLQRNVMASARTIAAHYRLGAEDVSFCVMPLFHVHGLFASTFAALSAGGSTVVPRRFTPHRFWAQARSLGATWVSAGPTLHQMILDKADGEGAPSRLRFTRSCSSALSPALMARAEDTYKVAMLEAYGMTEASHQMASNPLPPAARHPSCVGIPTGTEIAVVDGDLRMLPAGAAGEVVIRGPGVTSGYANNPEANAEAFFDGWFRTGDRGALRDGYLYLEGRLKEMIIRGGENISPAEIEAVLLSHPAVAEAVCFGIEDDKYGEIPAAAVTLSADSDSEAIAAHCRERLAGFKVPSRIYIIEQIPRTPTGKVQRRRVAELLTEAGPTA
jgi:acyl-CoA synthetase (AMP-forming)/AMP-acid ligase II